ncbi:MAG: hypothetical protein OQJ84_09420 [Xanthomonadales bacterium]|nr:hypothetical protein [Xanthomonadales bacterium]
MRNRKFPIPIKSGHSTWRAHQAILCVLLLAAMQGSALETDEDMQRLQAGEILVQTIHEDKSGGAARVTGLFYAEPEEIWNVIGYCKNEFVYVRGLEVCEVLVPGLQYIKKHHRVNNNWYTPTLDFVFEARRTSPTHGDFNLVGGDLKVMEGQWDFQPAPGGEGLVVSHDIRIQSKLPAPRWLVRRVLKKDLPDMLACIRGMAGASGNPDLLAGDLERCPGDTSRVGK